MADLTQALFYNSENGDRVYDADSFEHLLKKFFTTGVFTGACQVTADGSGMTCQVGSGYSNCDGKVRFFSSATALALDTAHATYNRIDTVVIERNDVNREITLKVVKGSYSANPAATAPVRTGGIYQLILAQIYIAAGTTSVTQSMITDKRPDTSVCGYVMCAVDTPDFSELYAQFLSQAADVIDEKTDDFDTWFQEMRDQLSDDAAGHLQLEIDALDGRVEDLENGTVLVTGTLTANGAQTSQTIQNENITAAMQPIIQFGNDSIFTGNATVSVSDGYVTVGGYIKGTTTFTVLLREAD